MQPISECANAGPMSNDTTLWPDNELLLQKRSRRQQPAWRRQVLCEGAAEAVELHGEEVVHGEQGPAERVAMRRQSPAEWGPVLVTASETGTSA
jgi:hypothetical protein